MDLGSGQEHGSTERSAATDPERDALSPGFAGDYALRALDGKYLLAQIGLPRAQLPLMHAILGAEWKARNL